MISRPAAWVLLAAGVGLFVWLPDVMDRFGTVAGVAAAVLAAVSAGLSVGLLTRAVSRLPVLRSAYERPRMRELHRI